MAQTPHQLTNGLETGILLAALTWGIALAMDANRCRSWLLALLCGAMPFIRPDLLAATLALFGINAVRHRNLSGGWQPAITWIARDGILALLAATPWCLWFWLELGVPFPTTALTKRYYFAAANLPSLERTWFVAKALGAFVLQVSALALGWIFLCMTGGAVAAGFLVFTGIFLVAYWSELPTVLITYELRYLYPFLPWAWAGFAFALSSGHKLGALSFRWLCIGLFISLIQFPLLWSLHLSIRTHAQQQLHGIATWVNETLPSGSILLIHDAGYIAYGTRHRMVDLVGLKSPWVVPYHRDLTFPTNGRERAKAIHAIALQAKPTHLVILPSWEEDSALLKGLEGHGWRTRLISDPDRYIFQVHELVAPNPQKDGSGASGSRAIFSGFRCEDRSVHVNPAAAAGDLAADFDRATNHDAAGTHALTIFRPADRAGTGGTHVTALDTLTIDGAITLHAHAAGADPNIHALGRHRAGTEDRHSSHSQNSKNLTHCSLANDCYSGVITAKPERRSVCEAPERAYG